MPAHRESHAPTVTGFSAGLLRREPVQARERRGLGGAGGSGLAPSETFLGDFWALGLRYLYRPFGRETMGGIAVQAQQLFTEVTLDLMNLKQ